MPPISFYFVYSQVRRGLKSGGGFVGYPPQGSGPPTDYKKIEEIVDRAARKRSTIAIVLSSISITLGLLSIVISVLW